MYPVEDAQQLSPVKDDSQYMPPDLLWRPSQPTAWLEAVKYCERAQIERNRRKKKAFSDSGELVSRSRSFFHQKIKSHAFGPTSRLAVSQP